MLKGWILYNSDPYDVYELNRLKEVAPSYNINLEVYSPSVFDILVNREDKRSIFLNGERTQLPDFLWARTGASTTYYGICVMRQFERIGVPTINSSESIDAVKDKFYTQQILAQHNLPIPKTIFVRNPVDINNIDTHIGFPCILKVLNGSQGKGVFLAKTKEALQNYLDIIESTNGKSNFIIQEFMQDSYGKDVRVYVIGGRVIGAMKRQSSNELDFRANISNGGVGELFKVTEEMELISLEATKSVGLDIAGIDLLFDKDDGWKICEINSNPGFRGFEKATEIDVASKLMRYINFKISN